jgi:Flp pilus assembly protein TadB
LVRLSRSSSDRPILITEAPVNADDEYDRRRKRYLVMMTLRAVCIIGAASTFSLSGWLAAGFVAAAVVLPWSAVLIANDRPPKQELRFRRFLGGQQVQRQLTAGQPQPPATEPEEPARPRIIDL